MARRARFLTLLLALAGSGCSGGDPADSSDGGAGDAGAVRAPRGLSYAVDPAVYTAGVAIAPNAPSSIGGQVDSYSVDPALPAGLSLDPSSGLVSGTPAKASAEASYTVTAKNAAGSATVALRITVEERAPTSVAYADNPAVYTVGVAVEPNAPTTKGGVPTTYGIDPPLPAGLALDPATGIVSGTPSAVAAFTRHKVTASNSAGSATVTLSITVHDATPSGLAYATNPARYTLGAAIADNVPTSTGSAASTWTVSPELPAGLSLAPATGVLSGTPTALAPEADYAVTASNSGGSATVALRLAVVDVAPADLRYAANPASYPVGHAIAENAPSSAGGPVTLYEVAPALPAGLSLDPVTGVLSGTPGAVAAEATYTVSASNSGGSATADLVLTIEAAAPSDLAYATNPAKYTIGTAVAPNAPTHSGGEITSYSVSPDLPAGLSLDATTGVITGAPTQAAAEAGYTVTGSNSLGSTTATLALTVADVAPTRLSYAANPARYYRTAPITPNPPSTTGGVATSYSVTPALPAGLSLDPATGVLSGTPSALAEGVHTVTATNPSGSVSVELEIAVLSQTTTGTWGTLALGWDHTCALMGGGVQCWGLNVNGQLGDGSYDDRSAPVPVSGILGGATAITAGASHTCAIVNGGAWCWGGNSFGQLGDGTHDERVRPVRVAGLESGVQAIAAGAYHTCAIVNGAARCWGLNSTGQLGNGTWDDQPSPVTVLGMDTGTRLIAAGAYHSCAVGNGRMMCWGANGGRQLWDGTTADHNEPVNTQGQADADIHELSLGSVITCLRTNYSTYCLGTNDVGQLGNGVSWPMRRVNGFNHGCALSFGGSLSCYGANAQGQAGDPSLVAARLTAFQLALEDVQAVAAGRGHSCAMVDGAVWCWGSNEHGQLGNDTKVSSAAPVKVAGIAGGLSHLVAGESHACVLVDGRPYCWGANDDYQLGTNTAGDTTQPTLPPQRSLYRYRALTSGAYHTCAEGRQSECWGRNSSGQLGRGTVTAREYTPGQSLSGAGNGTDFLAGSAHTCLIGGGGGNYRCVGSDANYQLQGIGSTTTFKEGYIYGVPATGDNHLCNVTSGGIYCWGQNTSGQLGKGYTAATGYGSALPSLSGAQSAYAGGSNSCATVNGGAKCWGATFGPSPVAISGLASGVQTLSMRSGHACAIVNGALKCLGNNGSGQLGNNSQGNSPSTPVQVQGLDKNVLAVAVGGSFTCALVGNDVVCWGDNSRGQRGLGSTAPSLVPAAPALSK
ncbi:MAG TPA: putative Ig domain-containing protein [Myxococcales bacterium]|jgi:alpha-tubulin suppressor-like RCC1 family protein